MKHVLKSSVAYAPAKKSSDNLPSQRCNLCAEAFHPRTVFDRFCQTCKKESDLFKFSEWLPELDPAIPDQLSA